MVIIKQGMIIEPVQNILDPFDVFTRVSSKPYPFILENSINTISKERSAYTSWLGRFSIVGCEPEIIIKAWQNSIEIIQDGCKKIIKEDPFAVLDSILFKYKGCHEGFPSGAAVGYFGYDLKNLLEDLHPKKQDPLSIPDMIMGIYGTLFVYDHYESKGYIVSSDAGEKRLERFKEILRLPLSIIGDGLEPKTQVTKELFLSNFTKDEYISAIKKAKAYIREGDIYQINLSQRFSAPFAQDPMILYSKLRKSHPVEFSAFFDYGDFQVISNSPECFLKIQNGIIETYPIKGTRPRGSSSEEDAEIVKELKTNTKELAEHIMIVDLERNDLGKVCITGTVRVKELERVVTYPTLHHMVSCVEGKIKDGVSAVDCIKPCFPGGSVTGAPKIKAMEIIDELEPTPRGIYTGAIGYIDFSGSVNLGMAIRTAVVKDKKLYLSVGGGIVADSVPEDEYAETLLKAEAFLKIL
ncbi:MAG: aminodeoxychorismate synthase component I [Deltaproteobacteria bacterium]|nr:aminodeoxychorismate synthase component I [Deltaproteobacteria bacterium]